MARSQTIVFKTLNNRVDPATIDQEEMSVAENIDIHDDFSISMRDGQSSSYSSSGSHSAWNTKDEKSLFFCEDAFLMKFDSTDGVSVIASLTTNDPVSFTEVNDIIVYSNNTDIGFIKDGTAFEFDAPVPAFKIPMAAGRFITFYKTRLYALTEDGLYFSDPYAVNQMDERNCLIPLLGVPAMLEALDDCLWIGKGFKTIVITGKEPNDFEYRDYTSAVVPGSAVQSDIPNAYGTEVVGRYAIWTSDAGICLGSNGGAFKLITEDFLAVKKAMFGAGTIRRKGGLAHYVVVLKDLKPEDNKFQDESIEIITETEGG
jgi:hypothetical protein